MIRTTEAELHPKSSFRAYWKNKQIEGSIFESNNCGPFEVIEYINHATVRIKFCNTGTETTTSLDCVYSGIAFDWMAPSIEGLGYIGAPSVGARDSEERDLYVKWRAMLVRCYGLKHKTYLDCYVNPIWYNFQNFLSWARANGYKKSLHLDKDVLVKGNREYGPDTCCFVPSCINMFVVLLKSSRGPYPIGVSKNKGSDRYKAMIKVQGVKRTLGHFATKEEAFLAYKGAKEAQAKAYAIEFDGILTPNVIEALRNFEVSMDD